MERGLLFFSFLAIDLTLVLLVDFADSVEYHDNEENDNIVNCYVIQRKVHKLCYKVYKSTVSYVIALEQHAPSHAKSHHSAIRQTVH